MMYWDSLQAEHGVKLCWNGRADANVLISQAELSLWPTDSCFRISQARDVLVLLLELRTQANESKKILANCQSELWKV